MNLTVTLSELPTIALLAVASHFIFANYEPDAAIISALYAVGSSAFFFFHYNNNPFLDTFLQLILALTIYTATLFASIAVYRLFLHRTRHIPGPTSLALSKWCIVPVDLTGKRPDYIDRLHKQYGNILRTGPREVSINDVNAINPLLGTNSLCTKGPWYHAVQGGKGPRSLSLHATTKPSEQKARRRIWAAGFSIAALREYGVELKEANEKLMSQFETFAKSGKVIQMDHWCQYFSFDIAGSLGFSRSFGMIESGQLSRPIEVSLSYQVRTSLLTYLAHSLFSSWREQWRWSWWLAAFLIWLR